MRPLAHVVLWALGIRKAETQTTVSERDCLARHARGKRHLVEIGVWHGVTTARLRSVMDPNGTVLAVDPFVPGRLGFSIQQLVARREVAKVANGKVQWVRLSGAEAGRAHRTTGREPIDFLFIDGDHAYEAVRSDWEAWRPLVASGGIVALHDSRSTPERAIDNAGSAVFTNAVVLRDPEFRLVEQVDSLTVVSRL